MENHFICDQMPISSTIMDGLNKYYILYTTNYTKTTMAPSCGIGLIQAM